MQSFFLDFLFFFLGYIYLLSPLVSFSSLDYIDFLTCHRVFSGHLDTVSLFFYQRAFSVIGTGFFFFFSFLLFYLVNWHWPLLLAQFFVSGPLSYSSLVIFFCHILCVNAFCIHGQSREVYTLIAVIPSYILCWLLFFNCKHR